jgi:TonB family protein
MFNALPSTPRPYSVYASVILHCLLLAWWVKSPTAIFVAPSSVSSGEYGTSVTRLYWYGPQSSQQPETLPSKPHLTWTQKQKQKRVQEQQLKDALLSDETPQTATNRVQPGPPAGTPYGSLTYGNITGLEIRPAIRIAGSEPYVERDDLQGVQAGNEVVEIVIDEQGNIIAHTVLASLGPTVDNKVLAALQNWRFRPATKNGIPIPSKQDVEYFFPTRH